MAATISLTAEEVDQAVMTVLANTKVSSRQAAIGLLRYGVEELTMSLGDTVRALRVLSRSGQALTRDALDKWHAAQDEANQAELRNAERHEATVESVRRMVWTYPDTRVGGWFIAAVSRYREVVVSPFQADRWESQANAEARCRYTEEDVEAAVRLVVERKWTLDPITVGSVIRRLRAGQ